MNSVESEKQISAWMLLAVGDERAFGGNDGYQDELSACYLWDSTVPNHSRLKVGDTILLWDKRKSIGISTIQAIEISPGKKNLHRCFFCSASNIKKRKKLTPLYKCGVCKREFNDPETTFDVAVTNYQTRHADGWLPIEGFLEGAELRGLCESPRSQHSLRLLNWSKFVGELEEHRVAFDTGNFRWYKY